MDKEIKKQIKTIGPWSKLSPGGRYQSPPGGVKSQRVWAQFGDPKPQPTNPVELPAELGQLC